LLIVEDDEGLRARVRILLADQLPQAQVAEANSLTNAREKLDGQPWDLVVLDIRLQGDNGLDLLAALRSSWPKLPVIVMSSQPEIPYARAAVKAGASAYLVKERSTTDLVPLIGRLLASSA
jgi:DNA-binding NarL/FixJ family response regulator